MIKEEKIVVDMLRHIGENPKREGLRDTPKRVVAMWAELFRGYDPEQMPKITTFQNGSDGILYDEMITDTGEFYSCCEHHLIPFFGRYFFAVLPHPKGKLLGLSKVGRIVDYYSARLQIQERLVHQISEHLWQALTEDGVEPIGMAFMMEAEHLCKTMRGVKKKGKMRTTVVKGAFKDDINTKSEFLGWVNSNGKG